METPAQAQSASDRYLQIAGPVHTILVLAALGGWAIWHKSFADQLSTAANPNRVRFYIVTLFYEWLLFVLVVAGGRGAGAAVFFVLGEHLHSPPPGPPGIWISTGLLVLAWVLPFLGPAHPPPPAPYTHHAPPSKH